MKQKTYRFPGAMKRHFKFLKEHKPWVFHYYWQRQVCKSKKKTNLCYTGIKALLSKDEVKELWFRDKAYSLKKPTLNRINSTKDYSYANSRFIELVKAQSRPKRSYKGVRDRLKGIKFSIGKGIRLSRGGWECGIKKSSRHYYLGSFKKVKDAITVYNKKARELFKKEDVVLNKEL